MGFRVISVNRFRRSWRAEIIDDSERGKKRIRPVIHAQNEDEAWSEARFLADRLQATGGVDLEDVFERYISSIEARVAPETASGYRRVARRIVAADADGALAPTRVSPENAAEYMARRQNQGAGAGTIRGELSLLRRTYDRIEVLSGKPNPFRLLSAPPRRTSSRISNSEHQKVKDVLARLRGPQALAGALALEESLKVREMAALRVSDFDLKRERLLVHAKVDRYRAVHEIPERSLSIGDLTRRAIASTIEQNTLRRDDFVFGKEVPGSAVVIGRDFSDAMRPYGINVSLCDLRLAACE